MAIGKPTDAVYRFKIDAYTPETMPMARLAEYMAELAAMLGEPTQVHFQRILPGSTVIQHRVEREAAPKVHERVLAVRRREAPADALQAYKRVNKMLREDNGVGALKQKGAVIIRFPGREQTEEKYPLIRQHGTIDGVLVGIVGADESVHIRLMVEDQQLTKFWTDRRIAKELGRFWDEPVRLHGRGRWSRDSEGQWSLDNFKIEGFEPLKSGTLSEALAEVRSLPLHLTEDALEELELIRHGPRQRQANGGH